MKVKEKKILRFMDWGFYLVLVPIILLFIPIDCFEPGAASIFFAALVVYMTIIHIILRKHNPLTLILEKRYIKAIISISITVVLIVFAIYFQFTSLIVPQYDVAKMQEIIRLKSRALWLFYFIDISTAVTFALVSELFKQRSHSQAVEAERNSAEIALYQSQVNPHFMLNTLNTLYGLHLTGSDKTNEIFFKFTNMLKYSFTTTEQDKVLISDEVKYIGEYIDIHCLRLSEHTVVNYSVDIDESALTIPPMLLIVFVENAFKYGVSSAKPSIINISITLKDRYFTFDMTNSIISRGAGSTGIGIKNSRKRLDLLYPSAYTLVCEDRGKEYITKLIIEI